MSKQSTARSRLRRTRRPARRNSEADVFRAGSAAPRSKKHGGGDEARGESLPFAALSVNGG